MFYTPAPDDDDSAYVNPVRRWTAGAGFWVEELACCLCGCLPAGFVFLFVGVVFLVRSRSWVVLVSGARLALSSVAHAPLPPQLTAASDPRQGGIRQYNRAVRHAPLGSPTPAVS